MKLKQYIQPKARIIDVNETEVICGSGTYIYDGKTLKFVNDVDYLSSKPYMDSDEDISGDAPTYRTTLWD